MISRTCQVWQRPIVFGVLQPERTPVFHHFDLQEVDGVLCLVLGNAAPIDSWAMKDILRAVHRLDPVGGVPIMVEQQELVRMTPDAKTFLARVCHQNERPVAFMAYDLPDRIQGDFFLRFHRPRFPFSVFSAQDEARTWFKRFVAGRLAVE